VPHNWTGSLAAKGQALALEADQVQDAGQYMQAALQACQVDGQQYALPVLIDSVALIYNKALVPTLPASFEGLVSLAQELTDAQNDRWGLVLPLLSPYHVYPFIDGYGGYVFRCEGSACNLSDVGLNSEGAVRAVEYLSSLYRTKKLFPESLADRDVMEQEALRLFSEGKAAMLIDGSWALPEIRAHGIDYGVAPIPTLPGAQGPPRPFTVVQAVFASANTAHPGEAVDLLNYVAGPESALALYGALGKTPVRRDVLRSPDLRGDRTVQGWEEQVTIGVPLPGIAELDYVWTPWGRALDEAIPGLTPAQEALDRAVEEIKGTLEQALVP
jgi:arabinogalactan oligomer/maltooligosaccharide transport system substrate-binding protein